MLLNAGAEERTNLSKTSRHVRLSACPGPNGLLAAAVARSTDAVQAPRKPAPPLPNKALANLLFQDFVYPFELTSS